MIAKKDVRRRGYSSFKSSGLMDNKSIKTWRSQLKCSALTLYVMLQLWRFDAGLQVLDSYT
jgi:hypothetical protein